MTIHDLASESPKQRDGYFWNADKRHKQVRGTLTRVVNFHDKIGRKLFVNEKDGRYYDHFSYTENGESITR